MTQGDLEQLALPIQKNLGTLESRVMQDIIRRIRANGEITSAADWQINRLYQMGVSKKAIKKAIGEALGLSKMEVKKLYHDTLYNEYVRNEQLYKEKGHKWIPYEKNKGLQDLVAAVEEQTNKELKNITQSLGFAIRGPDGKVIQSPLMDFYQGTLDDAMMDIASGAFDYNTVIKRTIQTMTNSGLRSIDYESGWSNRVDVAARRAVMTGFNQLQAKINEQVARDLKTDYFEVSWHGGARPEHQVWQGRVFSHKQLVTVCGLGSVTGLCGANCYHQYNAFIPGVSVRTYTDEQLDQMNAEENKPKKYNGKEYTTYEALQKQREMETLMRKQRQDIKLLKDGKASEDDILAAKVRYRVSMEKYADFSGKMGLPQQKERIYMDGLGRMVSGKGTTVANIPQSGIIKSNKSNAGWSGVQYSQSYTKATAIDRLKKEYGIDFKDSVRYPMDDGILTDCVGWLDSFSKEFAGFTKNSPVKLPVIKCAAPSQMRNSVGYYKYYADRPVAIELALNGEYHSDRAAFQNYVDACIQSKWYPANATIHKTFVHEYGHYVSHSLQCISGKSNWQHEFLDECLQEFKKINPDYTFKTHIGLKDHLSEYGTTSESECFAEAFAEYFGGVNPREFAKIFGKKLEKQLKGVK